MSGAIGPGDWVEALGSDPAYDGFIAVTKGEIYCVEAAFPATGHCSACGVMGLALLLVGDRPDPFGNTDSWCGECGFRPIYRPRADLIESLKAPPLEAPPAPTAPKVREDA